VRVSRRTILRIEMLTTRTVVVPLLVVVYGEQSSSNSEIEQMTTKKKMRTSFRYNPLTIPSYAQWWKW
jgi:hypothetical protein